MQASHSAVWTLMVKKGEESKYIQKNVKYFKPMIIERLKSTVLVIILYCEEQQASEGMLFATKFPYMLGLEVGRAYLKRVLIWQQSRQTVKHKWRQRGKKSHGMPWRFGSVARTLAHGLKGHGFHLGQEHIPWLQAGPLSLVRVPVGGN